MSAYYGEYFLCKVIDTNDVQAFARFRIRESDFITEAEKRAYQFIQTYAKQNDGQAPSYAVFIAKNPDIAYTPDVSDTFEYLAESIKNYSAKIQYKDLAENKLPTLFAENEGAVIGKKIKEEVEQIEANVHIPKSVGISLKTGAEEFWEEYQKRKKGTSFRIWKSKFPTINEAISGYFSGNMYTWYGRSGRGKSVFTMEDGALEPAMQGANVLVWAMEMSRFEWMARAYSSLSAKSGIAQAEMNGQRFSAGFENKAMLMGKLPEEFEKELQSFLGRLKETIPGNIILRAGDDASFHDRSLRALESDIVRLKPDIVVIDPFYYLDYERNTSKTTGGDAANTSMKLRRLAGRYGVVMHVITQADEVKEKQNGDWVRELKPPQRSEIKKTKAVLEDATNVFGIDSVANEGRGMIVVGKGRNGGEDTVVETIYLPNYGIVREAMTDVQNQFGF